MNKVNVLIAGCGYVGSALARDLIKTDEYNVWGLRRDISRLPKGIHGIQADLTSGNFGQWPEHIDYLVYSVSADSSAEESYHQAYVQGLSNILGQLQILKARPARILFTSSTSVYHQGGGEWVDEQSEVKPQSFSGQTMLKAESLLKDALFSGTAVRFGGIYGPGRGRLIERVRQGKGCQASPVVYGNRIHRDDCAGILAHLITLDRQGKALKDVYIGVDHQPAPIYEVLQWLAGQVDVSLDNNHPTPARGNRRCSNKEMVSSGYRFLYPDYLAGYGELLQNEP